MLDVIESDFTKGITEMVAAEQTAAATHDKETKENAVEKTTKEQDVKYKSIAGVTTDRDGVKAGLNAVIECVHLFLEHIDATIHIKN